MCLVIMENSGYHSHTDLGKELQRSIVAQKLAGVVDDVALQRSNPSAASSFSTLVVPWMAHKSTAEPSHDGLMKHKKKQEHAWPRRKTSEQARFYFLSTLLGHSSTRLASKQRDDQAHQAHLLNTTWKQGSAQTTMNGKRFM